MFFIFKGGDEFVKLKIDRVRKRFEIASKVTNYRFLPQSYVRLFGSTKGDMEEAKKEMEDVESMTDNQFKLKLTSEFLSQGYILVKYTD